jgi:hypothetical protein
VMASNTPVRPWAAWSGDELPGDFRPPKTRPRLRTASGAAVGGRQKIRWRPRRHETVRCAHPPVDGSRGWERVAGHPRRHRAGRPRWPGCSCHPRPDHGASHHRRGPGRRGHGSRSDLSSAAQRCQSANPAGHSALSAPSSGPWGEPNRQWQTGYG